MVPYDGNDEEDPPSEIIVNPVQFAESKAIASASNEVPTKFKETSKELSETCVKPHQMCVRKPGGKLHP